MNSSLVAPDARSVVQIFLMVYKMFVWIRNQTSFKRRTGLCCFNLFSSVADARPLPCQIDLSAEHVCFVGASLSLFLCPLVWILCEMEVRAKRLDPVLACLAPGEYFIAASRAFSRQEGWLTHAWGRWAWTVGSCRVGCSLLCRVPFSLSSRGLICGWPLPRSVRIEVQSLGFRFEFPNYRSQLEP